MVIPKHGLSYLDDASNEYVPCGEILSTEFHNLAELDTSIDALPISLRLAGDSIIMGVARLSTYGLTGTGWLLKMAYTRGSTPIASGTILTFYIFPHLRIQIKATKNIPANREIAFYGVLDVKRRVYNSLTVNINDIPNVTIPLFTDTSKKVTYGLATNKSPFSPENNFFRSTMVFSDTSQAPWDRFMTWDSTADKYDLGTWGNANKIVIYGDHLTNTTYYTTYDAIVAAYVAAGGVMAAVVSTLRIRQRGYNLKPVIGDPSTVVLKDQSLIYNYPVGAITKVTNFALSPDGFTITGKFNGKCTIEHRFGTDNSFTINSDADGNFSYTATKSYLGGGTLSLIPSNIVGTYKASIIQLVDQIAPNAVTDVTITSTGVYGIGEVGATFRLYDDQMIFIGSVVIPASGVVNLSFSTPIEDTVTSKDFIYTIGDAAGNTRPGTIITYISQLDVVTGPIDEYVNDIARISVTDASISATATP